MTQPASPKPVSGTSGAWSRFRGYFRRGLLRRAWSDFRQLARARTFEVVTVTLAVLSFGAFFYGSFNPEAKSGIGGPSARLTSGRAARKAAGEKIFLYAGIGDNFYDLDAVWTAKGESAELRLESGASIQLGEKTLVILKRPFRQRLNLSVQDQIRVVSGEVRLTGLGRGILKPARSTSPGLGGEGTSQKDKRELERDGKVFPPNDALLYYKPAGSIEVRIAWTDLVQELKPGIRYLKVEEVNGSGMNFIQLGEESFAPVSLKNGRAYRWSIIDENKALLLGPFSFELRHLDAETAKKLLTEKPDKPLFVYW